MSAFDLPHLFVARNYLSKVRWTNFFCSGQCLDEIHDTTQCAQCQNWVHNTCSNLTKCNLKHWSADYLLFLCMRCAFYGSDYNSSAALERYVIIWFVSRSIRKKLLSLCQCTASHFTAPILFVENQSRRLTICERSC